MQPHWQGALQLLELLWGLPFPTKALAAQLPRLFFASAPFLVANSLGLAKRNQEQPLVQLWEGPKKASQARLAPNFSLAWQQLWGGLGSPAV